MARLSFNRVFFGLMTLSFISAFLAPQHLTDAGRGQFEGLFVPRFQARLYRGQLAAD